MSNLHGLLTSGCPNVAGLERIYAAYGQRPDFVFEAVSSMRLSDPDVAWRAIWLVRRFARDQVVPEPALARIAASVDEFSHWVARLALCQLFAETGCPSSLREAVFPFLCEAFADRRVIVRAWAISALMTFQSDPRYRSEIHALLRRARQDTGKSMQARLRRVALRQVS